MCFVSKSPIYVICFFGGSSHLFLISGRPVCFSVPVGLDLVPTLIRRQRAWEAALHQPQRQHKSHGHGSGGGGSGGGGLMLGGGGDAGSGGGGRGGGSSASSWGDAAPEEQMLRHLRASAHAAARKGESGGGGRLGLLRRSFRAADGCGSGSVSLDEWHAVRMNEQTITHLWGPYCCTNGCQNKRILRNLCPCSRLRCVPMCPTLS